MYIYNSKSRIIHKTDADGRTHESCNVDQIANRLETRNLSEIGAKFTLCKRCFALGRIN